MVRNDESDTMKFFYWLVKLTDYTAKPPLHHGWQSAVHRVGGPMSPREVALAMLLEIRRIITDEAVIRGADWQLVETDGELVPPPAKNKCRACFLRRGGQKSPAERGGSPEVAPK